MEKSIHKKVTQNNTDWNGGLDSTKANRRAKAKRSRSKAERVLLNKMSQNNPKMQSIICKIFK